MAFPRRAASGLACLLAMAGVGCHKRSADATAIVVAVPVVTQPVRTDTLRDLATAAGTVVPSTAADLTISAAESGTIVELPKHENDNVAVGDLLVKFDFPSVTGAIAAKQLAVADARARADDAKAAFAKINDLYARGLEARLNFEAARSAAAAADSALGEATSQLTLTETEAGRAVVRAAFPGRVVKLWHNVGDMVAAGSSDPVLRVVDPTRAQVVVPLPADQLAHITAGQVATVHAFDSDSPIAATVINKTTPAPASPTGEVRLAFDLPPTLTLDAPVSVEILLDQRSGALVVPTDAIQRDGDAFYVIVAGDDQRAHRRDVRTGLTTRALTQIASGLAAGERVITSGAADLTEGTPIAVGK